jgi:Holliday junction resolvasome RuvABC ATP-dependent DNA helicase subunit
MADPKLEEVFKKSGIPTFTFVKPVEYDRLLVSLRTPGRGVVIEGPSGIGKSTSVEKAVEQLGLAQKTRRLSARKFEDRRIIAELPRSTPIGIVVVDDFHRLDNAVKHGVADFLKTLADEEPSDSKLVLVGINKVGESLINIAPDLNDRIETIHFGTNPEDRVLQLITRGEEALNIVINTKDEIAKDAHGSFSIAQMLCHWTCIIASVLERRDTLTHVRVSLEVVKEKALHDLAGRFLQSARKFATGPRLRMEGRAPYLHILHWLSQADDWTL